MKVKIEGPQGGVRQAIEERLLRDRYELSMNGDGETVRVSTFVGVPLADITTEALFGLPRIVANDPYSIIRIFDGEGFRDQSILLLPFIGSMSETLGFPCNMGSCLKFIKKPAWLDDDRLISFLIESKFKGFVTLEINETTVQKISLGITHFGAFALMERWSGSIVSFDQVDDSINFREAWMVASLVACYPFPWNCDKTETGVKVDGVTEKLLKHFWPFSRGVVRQNRFTSVDCVLGIATSWEQGTGAISRMIERLTWTCQNLIAPMKMYRTDLTAVIHRKLDRVKEFLV